jgi:hypothetical protein
VLAVVRRARAQLPPAHRDLLDQLGVQETAIHPWPTGVQDLYRSIGEAPPPTTALEGAAALWLDGIRTVAFNASLLEAAVIGLSGDSRHALIASIAWHEYGHALSLTRSTYEQRDSAERFLGLLPERMRVAIDYPGTYRRSELFDEVIATIYAAMIARVRTHGYVVPSSCTRTLHTSSQRSSHGPRTLEAA